MRYSQQLCTCFISNYKYKIAVRHCKLCYDILSSETQTTESLKIRKV